MPGPLQRLRERLAAPVDIASLAAFRVLFGLVMAASVARFMAHGWVTTFFVEPAFHFTYGAFPFVRPWPGVLMHVHYACLLLAALGIASGCFYRVSSLVFFFGFTYAELIDKSLYLNHYYLVSLLAAFGCVLPAASAFSFDAFRHPERRLTTLPGWALAAMCFQIGLVYVFAGIAKLNHDWLVEAEPLRIWLAARSDWPIVGRWLGAPEVALAASWAGAAFDLGIVPLLLARRTRPVGLALVVGFHLVTAALFPIGVFPWLMIAASTLFLPPAWPRRALEALASRLGPLRLRLVRLGPVRLAPLRDEERLPAREWRPPGWLPAALVLHSALQVAVPLRQHWLRANSAWTLEGFNFAWNVMVAEKAGAVSFRARDRRSGESLRVEPRVFLAHFQEAAMAQDPDLVRQAALLVAARFRAQGRDVAVYADAVASLNGRADRPLVDPAVDLTGPLPKSWILPLE